jgi:hypothetical protein
MTRRDEHWRVPSPWPKEVARDQHLQKLAYRVAIRMAYHADFDTGLNCRPGAKRVADELGMDRDNKKTHPDAPDLEEKARALPGPKGYVTNLRACPDGTPVTAEFVIGAYHQLFQIGKSFRMSKHDLQARPVYHRKRDSIEAHLTIMLAALAAGVPT